jgi:hypothetical protein
VLLLKAPPTDPRSNFPRFYTYFVKEKLLPDWEAENDPANDANVKGNDVDLLCLKWAEQHRVPLVSWEGLGPSGPIPSKLIPREAKARAIELVTPEQLLAASTLILVLQPNAFLQTGIDLHRSM